jgi:hypothetical protein
MAMRHSVILLRSEDAVLQSLEVFSCTMELGNHVKVPVQLSKRHASILLSGLLYSTDAIGASARRQASSASLIVMQTMFGL